MSDHNPGLRPWRDIARRECRQIMVGNVPVGGGAPISVQTMTNTLTNDPVATIDQIRRCEEAGADHDLTAVTPRDVAPGAQAGIVVAHSCGLGRKGDMRRSLAARRPIGKAKRRRAACGGTVAALC